MFPARGSATILVTFLALTVPLPGVAATSRSNASARGGATRAIREDDLLRMEWVADPRISPDGRRIAFTRVAVDTVSDEYRTSIWLIDAAGGEPRPLTTGPRDTQPRWSPEGRTIAFSRGAEGKPTQIYLLPMTGGESTQLTRLKGGATQPVWSPNGERIVFTSTTNPKLDDDTTRAKPKHEPGRVVVRPVFRVNNAGFTDFDHPNHLWVVGAGGGKPRQLTTGGFDEGGAQWSRDGKSIRFVSDRRKEPWFGMDDANLYEVLADVVKPVGEAGMRLLVDIDGPVGRFDEARDGRIVTVGNQNPKQAHSYDQDDLLLATGPWPAHGARNLTAGYDFDIGSSVIADQHPPRGGGNAPLAVSPDGQWIYAVSGRRGAAPLVRVSAADGRVEPLIDESYEVIAGTCTPDARIWAITLGSVSSPVDLYRFDAQTRELKKLWGPNDALLAGVRLGAVEKFTYPSFDGRTIDAWIVKPPGFTPSKKYPMVLEIHGGPHTAYGVSFFHEFQMLAGAGYVVLYTNPRGSTTYGQEFGNIIQYHYPGDDARDLEAGVDAMIARGSIDAKHIGVTGGSGGGLLTNWLIGQTRRYAAAVTDRCVSDWASFYYTADFTLFTPTWFQKPPYEDPEDYRTRSPVTYAASITTPLMVLDGEDDWRTPIGQGEAIFRSLKQQKKTAVMVRFPGENHELSRSGAPSRRVQRLQHIHKWFDKFLLGKPIHDYDG